MVNMEVKTAKRLIYGHYAKDENVIAFCHVLTHRGFLSKTLVQSHDCLAKKCPFLEKIRPEYWEAIERAEKEKKNKRLRKKQVSEKTDACNDFIRKILEGSGHIYVTSIKEESRIYIISYIYDKK
jgi:glutamate synthase domain-containing protein 1